VRNTSSGVVHDVDAGGKVNEEIHIAKSTAPICCDIDFANHKWLNANGHLHAYEQTTFNNKTVMHSLLTHSLPNKAGSSSY
jgi:hypothetical protein